MLLTNQQDQAGNSNTLTILKCHRHMIKSFAYHVPRWWNIRDETPWSHVSPYLIRPCAVPLCDDAPCELPWSILTWHFISNGSCSSQFGVTGYLLGLPRTLTRLDLPFRTLSWIVLRAVCGATEHIICNFILNWICGTSIKRGTNACASFYAYRESCFPKRHGDVFPLTVYGKE